MASYSPLAWHDFFIGTIGAAAALTGLLFVAISINLEQILKYPQLPGRAAGTLGILVSGLVVSGFTLAPEQGNHVLGIEIAVTGAVVAVQAIWVTHGKGTPDDPWSWLLQHLASLLLPSIAFVIGGVSLVAGSGRGLYWVFAGFCSSSFPLRSMPGFCWSRSCGDGGVSHTAGWVRQYGEGTLRASIPATNPAVKASAERDLVRSPTNLAE